MFALLLLAQTAPAAIVSPERADARCVAAFGAMANDDKADVQHAAQLGALYFYGKLVGRRPGLDLRPVMLDAAQAIGPIVKAELSRCGKELGAAGTAMQAAGQSIASPPTPPPPPTPTRPVR